MSLELYGRKDSINVQKVMWLLAELGIEYTQIEKGGSFGGLDEEEFLALNPFGRVPVLKDGDYVLSESNAILRYIASTQPGGEAFYPADPEERGKIDMWMDYGSQTLFPEFVRIFTEVVRVSPKERRFNVIAMSTRRFQAATIQIGKELGENPWIMGQQLTLADIANGAYMYRFYALPGVKRVSQGRVESWANRIMNRPASKSTVCTDFRHMFVS